MAWPADKRFMTPEQFRAHVAALDFSRWRPIGIVWHNTASPTLKRWHEVPRARWMANLESYYKGLGWNGGPHLFVDDGDDGIGLFNPLNQRGTHSPSFNAQWIGIEHVGDYSREDDDAGAGLRVKENGIVATAILCERLGLDPRTHVKLHKEDPRTDHDCPGKDMAQDKAAMVEAVIQHMGGGGDHAPDWGHVADLDAPPRPSGGQPSPGSNPTAPSAPPVSPDASAASPGLQAVWSRSLAIVARVNWANRGFAPVGYVKGIGAAYIRARASLADGNALVTAIAAPATQDDSRDVLSWYRSKFDALGLELRAATSAAVLQAVFVLLLGLGMRESSGKFCEGRDASATNTSADTAEAGLFQMSWDARHGCPELVPLLRSYLAGSDDPEGLGPVFHEGVRCSEADMRNFGNGDGMQFQRVCKSSPMFAVLAAAIAVRHIGGRMGHWGPIRRREVELRREAVEFFRAIDGVA